MNFSKVIFLLLVIGIAYLAAAESRQTIKTGNRRGYRLFRREHRPRYRYEYGRQNGHEYYNNKQRDEKDNYGDYDDLDENEWDDLDLKDANRMFFFMKNKGQTAATTQPPFIPISPPTTITPTPITPTTPITPPSPITPPTITPTLS